MPPNKKPVRKRDNSGPLKAVLADARREWYQKQNLSPRVGRPPVESQRVVATINALAPVLQRLQRWRARHPDQPFRPISQYRLKQVVARHLGTMMDERTLRDVCKKFRLVRGSKTMGTYTWQEWTWLVKHATRADKDKARNTVASILENQTRRLQTVETLMAKHPRARGFEILEVFRKYHLARIRFYTRVLTLFSSPAQLSKISTRL